MVGDILYSGAFRAHSVSNLSANFGAFAGGATAVAMGTASGTNPVAVTVNSVFTSGVDSVRMNRGISYVSPTFSGFTARVDYANDKTNSNVDAAASASVDQTSKHQGLTVNYAGGPLRVAVSTHTAKADMVATAGTDTVSELKVDAISAAYQLMPALSLQASYANSEYKTGGAMTSETKAYRLGANYNVGKWVFAAQYGTGDVSTPTADVANSVADATVDATYGKGTAADRTAYQLAAIYNLSKRTNLYIAFGTQEQEITAANARASGGTPVPATDRATAVGDKIKYTQTAVGVRHSF
jgi:predicted porin